MSGVRDVVGLKPQHIHSNNTYIQFNIVTEMQRWIITDGKVLEYCHYG